MNRIKKKKYKELKRLFWKKREIRNEKINRMKISRTVFPNPPSNIKEALEEKGFVFGESLRPVFEKIQPEIKPKIDFDKSSNLVRVKMPDNLYLCLLRIEVDKRGMSDFPKLLYCIVDKDGDVLMYIVWKTVKLLDIKYDLSIGSFFILELKKKANLFKFDMPANKLEYGWIISKFLDDFPKENLKSSYIYIYKYNVFINSTLIYHKGKIPKGFGYKYAIRVNVFENELEEINYNRRTSGMLKKIVKIESIL